MQQTCVEKVMCGVKSLPRGPLSDDDDDDHDDDDDDNNDDDHDDDDDDKTKQKLRMHNLCRS